MSLVDYACVVGAGLTTCLVVACGGGVGVDVAVIASGAFAGANPWACTASCFALFLFHYC